MRRRLLIMLLLMSQALPAAPDEIAPPIQLAAAETEDEAPITPRDNTVVTVVLGVGIVAGAALVVLILASGACSSVPPSHGCQPTGTTGTR